MMLVSPLIGLGLNHSLLRYGPDRALRLERRLLYLQTLWRAVLRSAILMGLLISTSWLICYNQPGSQVFLVLLSVSLIGDAAFSVLQSYLRIIHSNTLYAKVTNIQSGILFATVILLTYLFGTYGYCCAYALTGIMAFYAVYRRKFGAILLAGSKEVWDRRFEKEYIKYGLLVGFGSLASQLALTTDTLMIGNLILDSSQIAIYRVASLVAFNILFIPKIVMTTDFVILSENRSNRTFLKHYVLGYAKSLGVVAAILIYLSTWISEPLLGIVFGEPYRAAAVSYNLLAIGLIGAFLLRIPLGNLLNAVGKAQWNIYSSTVLVVLNIPLTYVLVDSRGIEGAALSTAIVWWLSGVICIGLFCMHLKELGPASAARS